MATSFFGGDFFSGEFFNPGSMPLRISPSRLDERKRKSGRGKRRSAPPQILKASSDSGAKSASGSSRRFDKPCS